jgi:Na+/proline symporter
VGVAAYTLVGGLRATFLTDYVHTFIIMIILVWFTIKVITTEEIGSIGALYDAVVAIDRENPVAGNYLGSHLTMRSEQCLYFGILHVMSVSPLLFIYSSPFRTITWHDTVSLEPLVINFQIQLW